MQDTKMLRVAIVGASGHCHYVKSVSPENAARMRVSALIADGADAERLAKSYPDAKRYPSMGECLSCERIDIAGVTPEFSHIDGTAMTCVREHIPVFLEKPFALEWDDLVSLFELSKREHTPIYPMFDMRFSNAYFTARERVRTGAVGTPILIGAQKSYKLGERAAFYRERASYGGTIPWVAIHAVDFVRYVAGVNYASVTARHTTVGNAGHGALESAAVMQFTTDEGAFVTITADYLRPKDAPSHGDDRLRIAGTKGVLEIRGEKLYCIDTAGEREIALQSPPREIFDDVIAMAEGKRDTTASAADGFYATAIALRARESADAMSTIDLTDAKGFLR